MFESAKKHKNHAEILFMHHITSVLFTVFSDTGRTDTRFH